MTGRCVAARRLAYLLSGRLSGQEGMVQIAACCTSCGQAAVHLSFE